MSVCFVYTFVCYCRVCWCVDVVFVCVIVIVELMLLLGSALLVCVFFSYVSYVYCLGLLY